MNIIETLKKVLTLGLRTESDGERAAALAAARRLIDASPALKHALGKSHHPNCAECCEVGRCHWCLAAPEHGTLTSKGADGFSYSACRAHLRYFSEAQRQANPHAGVDLTAGLRDLDIASPSPLLR